MQKEIPFSKVMIGLKEHILIVILELDFSFISIKATFALKVRM